MDFTTNGEKLASVGQNPDFMLTVWDWAHEKVILHCKAFGQDVSKVCGHRKIQEHRSAGSGGEEGIQWQSIGFLAVILLAEDRYHRRRT